MIYLYFLSMLPLAAGMGFGVIYTKNKGSETYMLVFTTIGIYIMSIILIIGSKFV